MDSGLPRRDHGSPVPALTKGARPAAPPLEGNSVAILLSVFAAVLVGAALWLVGYRELADGVWAIAVLVALVPLGISVARDLLHRETGVDLIALLAMAGSLVLGQYLAGAIIGLMLSGGQALERYASTRARRELSALVARAPRSVHRREGDDLVSRDIGDVEPGDVLVVKSGEIVPVDGTIDSPVAVLDESALTGEAMPVTHARGDRVRSGVISAGAPFDMRALTTAEESTYAGIVRLVREAQASKAPFVRLADRFALWFLPLTLLIAGIAWVISGNPVRALAVLVVATPCPLILAAPVAIVAGISRAAHRGVIVKGGGALETLARARTVVFDKTGTLTVGSPQVASIEAFGKVEATELLRLAASLDQMSPHVYAEGILAAAQQRGLELVLPESVHEEHGSGIEGTVGWHRVAVGQARWLLHGDDMPPLAARVKRRISASGDGAAFIAVDGALAGALVMVDPMRPETPEALQRLRAQEVARIVLLSGDRKEVADRIGRSAGVDAVMCDQTAQQKVDAVRTESREAVTVMVGDGINDAPALAAADVGVAMGARGATAASEAADAVIVVDQLDRVAEAIAIARSARNIALQSVVAGMALSVVGMILATFGVLPPVAGAFFQEAIDVAVILNALRALGTGGVPTPASLRRGRTLASA
ncbi:MAG TPA: heavy metal translocating P-type ATPase [Candidatus Dormibacteraeota bacterium]|nr:heavy metal translocating P-type ATPase [Candidatus Dormibacteraeota bacterium]